MRPAAFFTSILALTAGGCVANRELDNQDSLVKIYSRTSLLPHGYGDSILEFRGRRYHHLASAGYVLVPGKNMIAFITEGHFEGRVIHFVPIDHGKEIRVKLTDSSFGGMLGGATGDPTTEYIETVDGDMITFATRVFFGPNAGRLTRTVVDLKTRSFTKSPP